MGIRKMNKIGTHYKYHYCFVINFMIYTNNFANER